MDRLSGNEHTTFVLTHTHTHSPESRLLSRTLPSPQPCCQAVSPDAPVLQLLFLLTSLPWQYQAGVPSAADHSQAEAGSFAGARQRLSSAGRGTRLRPVPLSGPCTAAAGRAECCWQAEGWLAPRCDLLVTVQLQDGALQGLDAGLQSQEPRQGWGPALFTGGGTVAAAQQIQLTSGTCIPHWINQMQPAGAWAGSPMPGVAGTVGAASALLESFWECEQG